MISRLWRLPVLALALLCIAPSIIHAQGSAPTSLSGVVTDNGGGVIPGATVVVKNMATGESFETTTGSAGTFNVPALSAGTYSVTVSLGGFKTTMLSDIRLVTASQANVQVKLEVGELTETVEVRGGSTLVQTASTAVTSTMSVEQLQELPLVSRNALYSVAFLPGVETAGGPRGAIINGLPNNAVNITIDGISTGNALQSTDGFFSMVTPRLDAIEEITVTGATPGAGGGSGAVQIAFTTRSGTNQFDTSLYHTIRDPRLNSNYYFNKINGLEKNNVKLHTYGGRIGGPVVIPGLYDGRNKAFFFFNMEHQYQPSEATRTRTILNPEAQNGVFSYLQTVDGVQSVRSVNLYEIAARTGNTATPDPFMLDLLGRIRQSTTTTGNVVTPLGATNNQDFVFQASSKGNQYAPTGRLDYNVTDNHRVTGTYLWQRFLAIPDLLNNSESVFPGFPVEGHQTSYRTTGSLGVRSTLSPTMVNELKGGWQWSPNNFFGNITRDMYEPYGGFRLNFPAPNNALALSDPTTAGQNNPAPRNTANYSIENTLSWQKGSHSLSFGGGFQRLAHEQNSRNEAVQIDFGVDTNGFDPANAMFTTANFPGASATVLTDARSIYAVLTGRVLAIPGTARLDAETGEYVYMGNLLQKSRMDSFDLYAQDQWRLTPTVTLNYGLRWDVQLPFEPVTNTWSTTTLADLCGASGIGNGPAGRSCNLFKPGEMPAGANFVPTYTEFSPGMKSYETDWNNIGPNVGLAWRPNVQTGWLRSVLGDPEQATLRGGYSMTYGFERMDRFTGLYGANPGGTTVATRNYGTGFPMLGPGETGPVLLREPHRLGVPAFQQSIQYPIQATAANSVNLFDPNIKTPYVHQFSAGFQRSIGRDMALEIRYVGNRNHQAWTTEDWNGEEGVFENNFINEFRNAQANLRAHVEQGCGSTANPCSFAYRGEGTGTVPLPIYLAYFNASTNANSAAAYASTNFRNSAWTTHLSQYEPDPADAANDLHASATFRGNALTAGLPANYFVMNPAIGAGNITRSLAGSRYNGLQVDLRRRLARGLLVNANYTFSKSFGTSLQTLRQDRIYLENTDVPHAVKMQWVYEVPVGRGRRFGGGMNKWLDGVLGNWEYSGTGRWHKELFDMGSVRVVGMSQSELQDAFKIRTVRAGDGTITVFSFPQDIVDNTRRAYNTDPTSVTGFGGDGVPTGRYIAPASSPDCIAIYRGDCGAPRQVKLLGPAETRFDMRINKRFPFGRKANFELTLEMLNVFDNINFNHQATPGGTADTFQVETAYTDINTTADPGGRIGQIQWRINW